MKNWTPIVVILAVVVIGALGFALYQGYPIPFVSSGSQTKSQVNSLNLYKELTADNLAFMQGIQLLKAGKTDDAKKKFEEALATETSRQKQGLIKFRIATAYEQKGDYMSAIPILKDLVYHTGYSKVTRAYAAQELGFMFYNTSDNAITNEVFTDPPLDSLVVPNDTLSTYRHLFEYAASIYPLSLSEYFVANWYANDILKIQAAATSSVDAKAKILADKDVIRERIAAGDADIPRIENDPTESDYVPAALMRKAVVIGKMNLAGDTSFGDLDTAFGRLFSIYSVRGVTSADGYARFQYATYLAKIYGTKRITDIQKTLSRFYDSSSNTYTGTSVTKFFANERTNAALGSKSDLILLASLDPKFKAYLISLGWHKADFAKS